MNLCPNWKSWIYPLSQISSVRQPTLNYAPLLWKVYWGCLLEEGLIYLRSTLQHLWEMLSFGLVLSILVCISERKAVYLMSLSFVMVTFKTFWSHKKKNFLPWLMCSAGDVTGQEFRSRIEQRLAPLRVRLASVNQYTRHLTTHTLCCSLPHGACGTVGDAERTGLPFPCTRWTWKFSFAAKSASPC